MTAATTFRHIRLLAASLLAALTLLTAGCVRDEQFDDTPQGNFDALWRIIDEHYCFLDYKQVDWTAVRAQYSQYISDGMSDDALFQVLGNMLAELRDGHVNLYASHNTARYWDWYLDYPRNYSEELVEAYLGRDYRIGGGLRYTILEDNVGYVSCTSFSTGFGDGNLSEMLRYMELCNGLIVDVRNNGGGQKNYATSLAERFTNETVLVGYISHKTGSGHSDFSKPEPVYVDPADGVRWQKPVVVLMNRHSYSATNDFINSMRYFPNVTLLGDTSGGGSGMPFSSELPNGWGVRFSACPTYDADMRHIESGIDPDVAVTLTDEDKARGVDTIIEAARALIGGE